MSNKFRSLKSSEIEMLKQQGCSSFDWSLIKVSDGFNPAFVKSCCFEGGIRIGQIGEPVSVGNRIKVSGIYGSTVVDSTIGDNCYINNVSGQLQGVDLGDNVVIDNCFLIENPTESTFGNGVKVSVLNEAGGREVLIFDKLSAQLAYILTFYRYKKDAISNIETLIEKYISLKKSKRSSIGSGAVLQNCGEIRSVSIGEGTELTSVQYLHNGTINSSKQNPTKISHGVVAKDFIIANGAEIKEFSNVSRCFIGESTVLAKGFTAEESILLSNGQFYNGEACSIFAGPHTVTHHKSTLLIGGAYSFFNAGSGTNQSNHLYKIGPVHQGVAERGVKTGSDSYILWPAHIGCFTVVLGKHYAHPDVSKLPFSYLIEKDGESVLIPGLNIKSIGTFRDFSKWEKRDKRASTSNDVIDYQFSNWYVIGRLLRGIDVLNEIKNSKEATQYSYNGVIMSASSVVGGIKLYQHAIKYYIGLKFVAFDSEFERLLLDPKVDFLSDLKLPAISDMAGMFTDKNKLFSKLDSSYHFRNIEEVLQEIKSCHVAFSLFDEIFFIRKYIWDTYTQKASWEAKLDLFLADFISSVKLIHAGILADAKKEFNEVSKVSFGVDDELSKKDDFDIVRGRFDALSEVQILQKSEKDMLEKANKYIQLLKNSNNYTDYICVE